MKLCRQHFPNLLLLWKMIHWCRCWLGDEQVTTHYLNQWWSCLITHIYGTQLREVKTSFVELQVHTPYQVFFLYTSRYVKIPHETDAKIWPLMPCFPSSSHSHRYPGYWLSHYNMPLPSSAWIFLICTRLGISIDIGFFNSSSLVRYGRHFASDILKRIF